MSPSSVLDHVLRDPNFIRSALFEEARNDWSLVYEFAQFILTIDANDLLSRFLLAKASWRLGDYDRAREEIAKCMEHIAVKDNDAIDATVLHPLILNESALYRAT